MGSNKVKICFNIDVDIMRQLKDISRLKSILINNPNIEFSDYDNWSEFMRYIVRLGLIKFNEKLQKKDD